LTAKIAKKQREEHQEKQPSCFATSALLFAIFAVKGFCEDHIELRTAWPGIVTGEALNLRLPIPPKRVNPWDSDRISLFAALNRS